jgi:hypothetical protein
MPRKRPPSRPIWVRANPLGLTPQEIARIRETRHITDLDLDERAYRALIWAGHRYAGELAYVRLFDLRGLQWMEARRLVQLRRTCADLGIEIGGRVRDRVFAPEAGVVGQT